MEVKALCEAICSLKEPSGIQHIDLSYHNIGNEGAAALSTLISSPTIALKSLRLQGNNIGMEGVAALVGPLKKITTLEQINLNGNPLGNKGGMLIAEMLNVNRTLTVVDIGNTDLGVESVVALSTVSLIYSQCAISSGCNIYIESHSYALCMQYRSCEITCL
jgi:Ran GTPase-activating protein (RanGAP) involved in mRNA processing and transport